jgi:transglutaminase-like putative cysteine protease
VTGVSFAAPPQWAIDCQIGTDTIWYPPDIPVAYLHLSRTLTVFDLHRMTEHHRICFKVLNRQGSKEAVLRQIVNDNSKIDNFAGWLFRVGEPTREIRRKDVDPRWFDRPYELGNEIHLRADFPDTESGDIIAFEYDVVGECPDCNTTAFHIMELTGWAPIEHLQFEVKLPKGIGLSWKAILFDTLSPKREGSDFIWEYRKIPFRRPVAAMPNPAFDTPGLAFMFFDSLTPQRSLDLTWGAVAMEAKDLLDYGISSSDKIKAKAHELTDSLGGLSAKAAAIGEFVSRRVKYDGDEEERFTRRPRIADKSLADMKGDCKDKAALMISLLHAINIPAVPVLVSTNRPVIPEFACSMQFNHVILAIPRDALDSSVDLTYATSGEWVYFDPTATGIPLGFMMPTTAGLKGLKLTRTDSALVTIPSSSPQQSQEEFEWVGTINKRAEIKGQCRIVKKGLAAIADSICIDAYTIPSRIAYLRTIFDSAISYAIILDYQLTSDSGAMTETFTVSGRPHHIDSEGRVILTLNPFLDSFDYPQDSLPRQRSYWFDFPKVQTVRAQWSMKPGWMLVVPPEDSMAVSSIGSTCGNVKTTDSTISFGQTTTYTGAIVPADSSESVRRFVDRYNEFRKLTAIIRPGKKQ